MAVEQVAVLNVDTGQPVRSIRELRQAVNQYRDDLVNLDETTEEYTQTVQKLSDAQNELNRINIITRQGSGDLATILTNTTRVAGNLSAGFTAAQGALALFGTESDALQQTFVRLQAAIALTQGLKGLVGLKNSLIGFTASIKASRIATQAFNTTLLANPIVLVGTAVVALAAYFSDLTKEVSSITKGFKELWQGIINLIPGINSTSDAFDKITQTIAGVATAIVRFITGPINALVKALNGDFSGALESIRQGFDILGNFDDGYTQKSNSNAKKRQDAADEEARAERLRQANLTRNKIEENEARYGSDWKYTQEGRRLYNQYFDDLAASYKEDTDEYRRAVNQKLTYDREYNNKVAALQNERTRKAEQEAAARLKILQDEQAEVDKILKAISDYNLPEIEIKINDLTTEYNRQLTLLEKYGHDTTELTRQYNERVNNLRLEAQREINAQIFRERQKDLNNLTYNNDEALREIDLYIIDLKTRLTGLEFNLANAIDFGDTDQITSISGQIEEVIEQINNFEDEQALRTQDYRENYANTLQEILNSEILTAEQRIEVQRELNDTLYQISLDNVNAQQQLVNRQIEAQERLRSTEDAITMKRLQQQLSYANSLGAIANSITNILGENTAANKAFAVASALIDTYKAAVSVMAFTPGGPIARIASYTAILGTGIAAVKQILSTKVPGSSDTTAATPIINVQPYYQPELTPTVQQLTATQEQEINNQRVYILESDIENSLNSSEVRVEENDF